MNLQNFSSGPNILHQHSINSLLERQDLIGGGSGGGGGGGGGSAASSRNGLAANMDGMLKYLIFFLFSYVQLININVIR